MSSTATTPVTEILNYFGGAWHKSSATEFTDVINPASGDVIAHTPLSSKADVDTVVQAAARHSRHGAVHLRVSAFSICSS